VAVNKEYPESLFKRESSAMNDDAAKKDDSYWDVKPTEILIIAADKWFTSLIDTS